MLDVLLSQETVAAEKKRVLQEEFGILMTRKLEGGPEKMCNLSKGVYDSGYDKAAIDSIRELMTTTGWDVDKCMDALNISDSKRDDYRRVVLTQLKLVTV